MKLDDESHIWLGAEWRGDSGRSKQLDHLARDLCSSSRDAFLDQMDYWGWLVC